MMQAVVAELKDKTDAVKQAFRDRSLDQVAVRDVVASSVVQLTEEGVLFLVIFLNTLSPEDGLLSFEQMEQGLAYWSSVHAVMPIAAPQQVRESDACSESPPVVERGRRRIPGRKLLGLRLHRPRNTRSRTSMRRMCGRRHRNTYRHVAHTSHQRGGNCLCVLSSHTELIPLNTEWRGRRGV
jgi:hypothetical protein